MASASEEKKVINENVNETDEDDNKKLKDKYKIKLNCNCKHNTCTVEVCKTCYWKVPVRQKTPEEIFIVTLFTEIEKNILYNNFRNSDMTYDKYRERKKQIDEQFIDDDYRCLQKCIEAFENIELSKNIKNTFKVTNVISQKRKPKSTDPNVSTSTDKK